MRITDLGPLEGSPRLARWTRCAVFAVLLASWCIGLQAAEAVDRVRLPDPGSERWKPLVFPNVSKTTRYTRMNEGGVASLASDSNCAASGLVLQVNDVDLAATPLLSWRWQVERELDIRDETSKNGDDFAARVYVMFAFDAARASWFARLRHRLGRIAYGATMPGSALNFVWTSHAAPGSHWDNPYDANAKMIALTREPAGGGWRRETVDVPRTYREHFDAPPPALVSVALMTDSDDSCQRAAARFSGFSFESRYPVDPTDGE